MPVNSKSRILLAMEDDWKKLRDITSGERAIKDAGETYLPKLTGQNTDEYKAYKDRGTFFNATARTIQGLAGAAMRKGAIYRVPKDAEIFIEDMTSTGTTLDEMANVIITQLLTYGFMGALVDVAMTDSIAKVRPYCAIYEAMNILNARTETAPDGSKIITLLTLLEVIEEPDPEDSFKTKEVEQVRVFGLDDMGFVFVQLWRKNNKGDWVPLALTESGEDYYPTILGNKLTKIPFQFFGATENDCVPEKPPLLDLACLNIKHWQVCVDYYHGLHFVALPTPWAAGFRTEDTLYIGSTKAWISKDPAARAGYLEFSGQGIGAIKDALVALETKMAVMGARMLEEQKAGVEAADTIRMRHSGDSATLTSIVTNTEKGLEGVLELMLAWQGKDAKGQIEISLNKDFVSQRITPQEIEALLKARQMGEISQQTFLHNLQYGEILPKNVSPDDEKKLIEAEKPTEFEAGPPKIVNMQGQPIPLQAVNK